MTQVKTRKARRLLIQLMTQADSDFERFCDTHTDECEVDTACEDWKRLILAYENAYAKLPTFKTK